jgi:hypothetical protein
LAEGFLDQCNFGSQLCKSKAPPAIEVVLAEGFQSESCQTKDKQLFTLLPSLPAFFSLFFSLLLFFSLVGSFSHQNLVPNCAEKVLQTVFTATAQNQSLVFFLVPKSANQSLTGD